MTLIQLSKAHQAAGIEIDSLAGVFSVFHHGRGLGPVYSSLDAAKAHADDLLMTTPAWLDEASPEYGNAPDHAELFGPGLRLHLEQVHGMTESERQDIDDIGIEQAHERLHTIEPVLTWTNIAAEYNATPDQRQLFSTIFEELNWVAFTEGLSMPMSPGLAIQEVIRELGVPRVDQIAWDGGYFGPYSVYGIQGHFTNGRSRIYVLDRGSDLLVLASEVWPEDDHVTKLLATKEG